MAERINNEVSVRLRLSFSNRPIADFIFKNGFKCQPKHIYQKSILTVDNWHVISKDYFSNRFYSISNRIKYRETEMNLRQFSQLKYWSGQIKKKPLKLAERLNSIFPKDF
jgi:hypothetical protein